jgi:two-component system phosphate regulon sensor histidine kinase PhoR
MKVEAIALSAEKQHKINLTVDPDVDLYGNAKELQSALSNLVFNAVRYTPDGGSIDIKFERYGSGAMFSVTDTGMGIASHHIPRITERFYRVDEGRSRESGGTGLGLAIVKHVLARHNSTLGISSKIGEGSRFSCIFPAERVTQNSNPSEA